MKPYSFFRLLFTLSLCFFALSCQKDIKVEPLAQMESNSLSLNKIVQNPVSSKNLANPVSVQSVQRVQETMQATVLVKRTDNYARDAYYKKVFSENPNVQAICFDRNQCVYFGINRIPENTTIVGTVCDGCRPNNIVIVIPPPSVVGQPCCAICITCLAKWLTAIPVN